MFKPDPFRKETILIHLIWAAGLFSAGCLAGVLVGVLGTVLVRHFL